MTSSGPLGSPLSPLLWHFWGRFFDNDLVTPGADPNAAMVKLLGILATPGLLYPLFRFTAYLDVAKLIWLGRASQALYDQVVWADRLLFLTLAFVVLGAVALLEWDALYLDRRDYVALMPLPLDLKTLFFAKIVSLAMLGGVFAAVVNIAGSVMFPFACAPSASVAGILRLIFAQFIATFCASLFAFLFFVALQGLLSNVLSYLLFRRVSVFIQLAGMVALLTAFALYTELAPKLPELRASGSMLLWLYPPFWFLGMQEMLAGRGNPLFAELASLAWKSLATAFVMAAATYTLSYRRHLRRTLEAPESDEGGIGVSRLGSRFAKLIARTPVGYGVLSFIGKTLARSGRQRLLLCAFLGIGLAFALTGIVVRTYKTDAELISVALVLSFFAISGMRYVFTVPAELPANWLFRTAGSLAHPPIIAAVRWAMFGVGVVPVVAFFLPLFAWRWGWPMAMAHSVFVAVLGAIMIEIVLIEFRKIPFTCAQRPGKTNLAGMWVVYWIAFTIYANVMARFAAWVVGTPLRMVIFYGVAAALLASLIAYKNATESHGVMFEFDDAGDPAVQTLDI